MVRLFILIKRKGTKRFLGVIPAKAGVTKSTLRKQLSKKIQRGFSFKIVTITQVKKVVKRQIPRGRRIFRRGSKIRRKIRSTGKSRRRYRKGRKR